MSNEPIFTMKQLETMHQAFESYADQYRTDACDLDAVQLLDASYLLHIGFDFTDFMDYPFVLDLFKYSSVYGMTFYDGDPDAMPAFEKVVKRVCAMFDAFQKQNELDRAASDPVADYQAGIVTL